jgi:hypothetical protein
MFLKSVGGNRIGPSGSQNKIFGFALPAINASDLPNFSQVKSLIATAINTTILGVANIWTAINTFSSTTDSSSSTTGSVIVSGGLGVAKNVTIGGQLTTSRDLIGNHTAVPINTTAAGTLAVVTSGVVAGLISSTSAAGVTVTLDSVANMITAFAAANISITTGTNIQFIIDNSQGANTVTLAVDAGATIAVATPAVTGGATLTVSTANKIAWFNLYLTSTTTAILSRVI